MEESPIECIRCEAEKPADAFHWQVSGRSDARRRKRDRTCKCCRAEQKRERDRTTPVGRADPVIARFLSLPVYRT